MIFLIFILIIVQFFLLYSILRTCSDLTDLLLEVERYQRKIERTIWRKK